MTDAPGWQAAGWLGGESATGINVTQEGALRYSAVFACVRVLAESVASLPLHVYERQPDGKERAPEHPLYKLLHDTPNPYMTSFELRETLQGHLALWGNGYCEIEYSNGGVPVALWPLRPDRMEAVQRTENGLVYSYRLPQGGVVKLPGYAVWHLRGLSSDGLVGYSPIALMRQAVALGLAAEEFGARFFGNDARPGGVLQHPGVLSAKGAENLRASWDSKHGGLSNSHRVAILEEGMTYNQIGVPPNDAQFLETRKMQVTEIARIFRVPPHMLADLDRATFSNIEHQSIGFVTHTIRPWLVRWEQSIQQQLMPERDRDRYFVEFLVDGLLRGDTTSRYAAYAVGRQNGWLSANDIRRMENMNPLPDEQGDVYLVPLNMVPAGAAGEEPQDEAESLGARSERRAVTLANGAEIRADQWDAAQARHRLQQNYLPLYEDVAGRIMRRETNDVLNAARRILTRGSAQEFRDWLDDFYTEHEAFVARQYEPVSQAYFAQVMELVERETGAVPVLTNFIAAYLDVLAGRHVVRNKSRLLDLLDNAVEDALGEIEPELETWRDIKPARIARDESVRASNAIALAAYGSIGRSQKVLITFGATCAFCNALAGKRFGIDVPFLSSGQSFMPAGATTPLVAGQHIGHAPIHDGCDCMVITA